MPPLFWGIALGAATAFMFDPQQGRRRRALLRDKWVRGGEPASDRVLVERVRAKLGRYVSHPSAIEVVAHDGDVVLTGDVLAAEHDDLVSVVAAVRGVRDVADHLDVHESAEGVSSLQGGARPGFARPELLQDHWSPGVRALAGGGALLLFLYGLAGGGIRGLGAIVLGSALLARAVGNRPIGELAEEARERVEERVSP